MVPALLRHHRAGLLGGAFRGARHPLHVQPFDCNGSRLRRQLPAHVMMPVLPPVGDLTSHFRQVQLCPLAPPASLPAPRKPALQALRLRVKTRHVRHLVKRAVAVRGLASVPVQPENVPVVGGLLDLDGEADDGVPLAELALQDRGDGPAAGMRVPALASYPQRAEGRNVQHAVPDLDAGDDS